MNIKYTFTLIFFTLFSSSISAQDYKANIRQSFTDFNNLMVKGEYNKSLDYVPEAMFKIVSRAQMTALFEQLFNNNEMEMKIMGFNIKEIGNSRKIDTSYYVAIKYTSVMTMRLNVKETESAETKTNRLNMLKAAFANTFGSDNIKLNEATETFTITPTKSSWAISKNGQTGWKFINVEPKQRLIMEKILPKELIEESVN